MQKLDYKCSLLFVFESLDWQLFCTAARSPASFATFIFNKASASGLQATNLSHRRCFLSVPIVQQVLEFFALDKSFKDLFLSLEISSMTKQSALVLLEPFFGLNSIAAEHN